MATVQLASGAYFDLQRPELGPIDIDDITIALSRLARFNGHTRDFYSVAQHSVLTSWLVPESHALEALLHDAAEAYIGDIVGPLKTLLPDLRDIEQRIDRAIRDRFGLPPDLSDEVRHADLVALATERRDLMPEPEQDTHWHNLDGIEPASNYHIRTLSPDLSWHVFHRRFAELYNPQRQEKTA